MALLFYGYVIQIKIRNQKICTIYNNEIRDDRQSSLIILF